MLKKSKRKSLPKKLLKAKKIMRKLTSKSKENKKKTQHQKITLIKPLKSKIITMSKRTKLLCLVTRKKKHFQLFKQFNQLLVKLIKNTDSNIWSTFLSSYNRERTDQRPPPPVLHLKPLLLLTLSNKVRQPHQQLNYKRTKSMMKTTTS